MSLVKRQIPGAGGAAWGDITGTLADQTDLVTALDLRVPYTGATGNVTLGTHGLTAGSVTASFAGAGPKLFVYNTAGGGASFSGGAGSSLAYLQFPSSKVFMIAPVSDITASPSSSDGRLIVDSTTVYVGAYGTLNSEKLIVWGHTAIQDNGAGAAAELRIYEPSAGGANYVGFKAPALTANKIWTLPSSDGTAGQALVTDGAGVLSFAAASSLDLVSYTYFGGL